MSTLKYILISGLFLFCLSLNSCSSDKTKKLQSGDEHCEAKQCRGKTEEGKRCKNDTKHCNGYCHLHQDQR
jgi:hypothetical protein